MTQNRHEGAGQVFPPHIDPQRGADIQDWQQRVGFLGKRMADMQQVIGHVLKSGYVREQQALSAQALFEATAWVADGHHETEIAMSALMGLLGDEPFIQTDLIHKLEKKHPGAAMDVQELAATIRVDRTIPTSTSEVVAETTSDYDLFDSTNTAYLDVVDFPEPRDPNTQQQETIKPGKDHPKVARESFIPTKIDREYTKNR